MEEAKAIAQQHLLQQIQRQKQQQDAMARFPSNIDAHLRPQPFHHRQQSLSQIQHPNPNQQIPNPSSALQIPIQQNPSASPLQQQQQQQPKVNRQVQASTNAELQMAYQDAWRVCHPDFKRPFSSIEDACERLFAYHVVADYEAEEDDKILDSDTTGQILSRSQQWDHNIAAKVAEFTATFEKQVLAFNIISRKREQGEFRTEEKLQIEQMLAQEERRAYLELRAEMEARNKAGRESHDANMQMAAMVQAEQARAESHARAEMMMMSRAPIRGGHMMMGHDGSEEVKDDEMMNGWGDNAQRDEREPSDDFLNDEETDNGDGIQSDWRGGGELDLNMR